METIYWDGLIYEVFLGSIDKSYTIMSFLNPLAGFYARDVNVVKAVSRRLQRLV